MIGPGQTVFFRYALPILPVAALFASVAAFKLIGSISSKNNSAIRLAVVAVVLLLVAGPLWSSVRLVTLMGREDTRGQARRWIESNVPEGQTVANLGGTFGDVQLRGIHTEAWWISYFYRSFSPEPRDLAEYVGQHIDDARPIFHPVNLTTAIRGHLGPAPPQTLAITHEHPLPYSDVSTEQLRSLEADWSLLAEFSPGPQPSLFDADYDLEDAFYVPIANFGDLERGGPRIRVWQKGEWTRAEPTTRVANRFFRHSTWRGNAYRKGGLPDLAKRSYGRALAFDSGHADAAQQLISVLCESDQFDMAVRIRKSFLAGDHLDTQIASAILLGRETEAKAYRDMSQIARSLGQVDIAAAFMAKTKEMGYSEE